jgi:hypothetical protein
VEHFGPNTRLVDRLLDAASVMDTAAAQRLFNARVEWLEVRADGLGEAVAARMAREAARHGGRLKPYEAARTEAAITVRDARRQLGPAHWLSVSAAVVNAAGALVVADLLDHRHFEALFGPWRNAFGDPASLVPMGPGGVITHFVPRRRRAVPVG